MTAHERLTTVLEQLTSDLAGDPALDLPAGGPKAGDLPDEHTHRRAALRRLRAGLVADDLIDDVTAEFIAADAATAAWLGASLADLAAITGNTRQAARKRWPDLGRIYRVRRWLANHSEDVTAIIGLVRDNVADLALTAEAVAELDTFADGPVVDPADRRNTVWQRRSELLDRTLRRITELARPSTPEAERALDGAKGLLAYYDSVRETTAA